MIPFAFNIEGVLRWVTQRVESGPRPRVYRSHCEDRELGLLVVCLLEERVGQQAQCGRVIGRHRVVGDDPAVRGQALDPRGVGRLREPVNRRDSAVVLDCEDREERHRGRKAEAIAPNRKREHEGGEDRERERHEEPEAGVDPPEGRELADEVRRHPERDAEDGRLPLERPDERRRGENEHRHEQEPLLRRLTVGPPAQYEKGSVGGEQHQRPAEIERAFGPVQVRRRVEVAGDVTEHRIPDRRQDVRLRRRAEVLELEHAVADRRGDGRAVGPPRNERRGEDDERGYKRDVDERESSTGARASRAAAPGRRSRRRRRRAQRGARSTSPRRTRTRARGRRARPTRSSRGDARTAAPPRAAGISTPA